ncbi:MAG: hypothetical protein A3B67_02580 [Burkholderiales bacterium RIFCSPHIGHO2_02_FULL_66_10]|jgi:curli biogenesis system outer membrane secretion channel CsgG|uniref:hypothetical protein n=1 Tax=Hydrogenophaga sp. TaxID=1904254 RepID=UPI0008CF6EBE|nr:hypothetical protein [Hydrogenophaga sp.]MBU4183279.1 hypothetical protein [Gammaproteobacteria bacterium]MBW8471162.1 hypothetical protein [Thiobacillus sp.]OGB14737.1 MAG: hypothetical protein A3B67_02580 [Burkholderiales bacterium RIFCSPHIGHO2_02_FULL_66_10]OGB36875.1 MAG: hypothetical protein A3I16_11315 [Burkholderiales bacterium RIFCSPLOWO2_02_FULL_66_35]PKO78842.1 MAG: hypothetical protein CVU21_01595 [Betaproteobacteria bacterium HGW-Betaproteobacteria-15]
MNKLNILRAALLTATLLTLPAAYAATMTEADYKVAVEKCDAMAGDAKSSCVAAAKTKFGQN